jgi:predicted rRNA methylase YqxC with S4 and FtsJ domains
LNNRFEIIQDSKVLKKIITELMEWCIYEDFFPYGIIKSPLLGKGGSLEFFVYLKIDKERQDFDYKNEVNNLL